MAGKKPRAEGMASAVPDLDCEGSGAGRIYLIPQLKPQRHGGTEKNWFFDVFSGSVLG